MPALPPESGTAVLDFERRDRICKLYGWPQTFASAPEFAAPDTGNRSGVWAMATLLAMSEAYEDKAFERGEVVLNHPRDTRLQGPRRPPPRPDPRPSGSRRDCFTLDALSRPDRR
jgi:hypothetical protein